MVAEVRQAPGREWAMVAKDCQAPGRDWAMVSKVRQAPGRERAALAKVRQAPGLERAMVAKDCQAPGLELAMVAKVRQAPGREWAMLAKGRLAPGQPVHHQEAPAPAHRAREWFWGIPVVHLGQSPDRRHCLHRIPPRPIRGATRKRDLVEEWRVAGLLQELAADRPVVACPTRMPRIWLPWAGCWCRCLGRRKRTRLPGQCGWRNSRGRWNW